MNRREKRILWCINHTTLRAFEVPLLRSLGFEVYTSKNFPHDEANLSASVDYSYDDALSIPRRHIKILNEHDFYSQPMSSEVQNIINMHFGTVFFASFPFMIGEFASKFNGRLILRVFGLAESYTYSSLLTAWGLRDVAERQMQINGRFWLAQSYPNLVEIEEQWLKDTFITLPLGLPQATLTQNDSWTGKDKRIFFVCPRIKSSPAYYGAIYERFKETFGDLPHVIAGKQPVPISDENVAGFVSNQVFRSWLKNCRVMFYHSREPRHLHYHPLEAIAFGMPVIYMKGGMLEKLAEGEQPGACETLEEAKEKIARALKGDIEFIKAVKRSEKCILAKFKLKYTRPQWKKILIDKVLQSAP